MTLLWPSGIRHVSVTHASGTLPCQKGYHLLGVILVVALNKTQAFIIWITFTCGIDLKSLWSQVKLFFGKWTEEHLIAKVMTTTRFYAKWQVVQDWKANLFASFPSQFIALICVSAVYSGLVAGKSTTACLNKWMLMNRILSFFLVKLLLTRHFRVNLIKCPRKLASGLFSSLSEASERK